MKHTKFGEYTGHYKAVVMTNDEKWTICKDNIVQVSRNPPYGFKSPYIAMAFYELEPA